MTETNISFKSPIKKRLLCDPSLFITLSESELIQWKHKLLGETIFLIDPDSLLSKHTIANSQDYPQVNIINFDSTRTRVLYTNSFLSFKTDLESLLLYYCIENSIPYKQGINEILAPFLFLHYQYPNTITIVEAYQLFVEFTNQFAYNYITDNDFIMLRHSLNFCSILLHYHIPVLHEYFEGMGIVPEMYALSWVLTVFSAKVTLEVLYRLWNELIIRGDPYMPYYLLMALLKNKTKEFFMIDSVQVMSLVCSFTIVSKDHLEELMIYALHVKETTPISFRMIIEKIGIFNRRNNCDCIGGSGGEDDANAKNNNDLRRGMEIVPIMPIMPGELCHIVYPDIFKCPNKKCRNFVKRNMQLIDRDGNDYSYMKNDTGTKNKKGQCWVCDMRNTPSSSMTLSSNSYVIFDIRERKYLDNCGLIAKSIFINDDFLLDEDQEKLLLNKFRNEKSNYHFIILLNKTSYFSSFEQDLAEDKKKEPYHHTTTNPHIQPYKLKPSNTKHKTNHSLITNKSSKTLKDRLKAVFGTEPSKKLQEYIKFKVLIDILTKNGFPYISYSYGGFEEIHHIHLQYNIPLILHLYSKCLICNKHRIKRGKSLTMRKNGNCIVKDIIRASNERQSLTKNGIKKLRLIDLTDIISSHKYQVYFSILVEYEERRVNKNEQLVVFINHKELIIYRKIGDKDNAEDYFVHLETYLIEEIVSARRDVKMKNVIMLMFLKEAYSMDVNESRLNERIAIDFNNNEEAKRFMIDLKDYGRKKYEEKEKERDKNGK